MRLVFNLNENFKSSKVTVQKTELESLSAWGSNENKSKLSLTDYSLVEVPRHRNSPFCVSKEINSRFINWEGDISTLDVDAVLNITNENLTDRDFISKRILERAGAQLKAELLNEILGCKTGDIIVTKGYDLPAKYIIHTVEPIYIKRYKTVAENILHSCYRNVLCKARTEIENNRFVYYKFNSTKFPARFRCSCSITYNSTFSKTI